VFVLSAFWSLRRLARARSRRREWPRAFKPPDGLIGSVRLARFAVENRVTAFAGREKSQIFAADDFKRCESRRGLGEIDTLR